jgi:acylphosphatase
MFSEIYCVVRGKVQRVGYRDSVETYAREHGLFGWIQNTGDGGVIVVLQGTPDELKACVVMLNQGSPLAHVDSVAVDWRTPQKQFDEFKVL